MKWTLSQVLSKSILSWVSKTQELSWIETRAKLNTSQFWGQMEKIKVSQIEECLSKWKFRYRDSDRKLGMALLKDDPCFKDHLDKALKTAYKSWTQSCKSTVKSHTEAEQEMYAVCEVIKWRNMQMIKLGMTFSEKFQLAKFFYSQFQYAGYSLQAIYNAIDRTACLNSMQHGTVTANPQLCTRSHVENVPKRTSLESIAFPASCANEKSTVRNVEEINPRPSKLLRTDLNYACINLHNTCQQVQGSGGRCDSRGSVIDMVKEEQMKFTESPRLCTTSRLSEPPNLSNLGDSQKLSRNLSSVVQTMNVNSIFNLHIAGRTEHSSQVNVASQCNRVETGNGLGELLKNVNPASRRSKFAFPSSSKDEGTINNTSSLVPHTEVEQVTKSQNSAVKKARSLRVDKCLSEMNFYLSSGYSELGKFYIRKCLELSGLREQDIIDEYGKWYDRNLRKADKQYTADMKSEMEVKIAKLQLDYPALLNVLKNDNINLKLGKLYIYLTCQNQKMRAAQHKAGFLTQAWKVQDPG